MRALGFIFIVIFFITNIPLASAQFGLPTQQPAALVLSPQYPVPKEEVQVELSAYTYDLRGATIAWFIDGEELTEERNERTITIKAPDLEETVVLVAKIRLTNGQTIDVTKRLTPTRVDIIIEADTLTPLQYVGRALPSSGSTIRMIAIPHTATPPNELSYTWEVDRTVLYGGPMTGKQVATFNAEDYRGSIVTLEVADKDGTIITRRLIDVPIFDPEVHFYELNALRGLSATTLQNPLSLIGEEIAVRAEPYYVAKDIFEQNRLIEWKINGKSIDNPSSDQQIITLRRSGGSGKFPVDFHIRSLQNLLQGARDTFVINF